MRKTPFAAIAVAILSLAACAAPLPVAQRPALSTLTYSSPEAFGFLGPQKDLGMTQCGGRTFIGSAKYLAEQCGK